MSKFTCLFVCIVAVCSNRVYAKFSDSERDAIGKAVSPIVAECAKIHGVSSEAIKAAQAAHNEDTLGHCFLACGFKKAGIMNDQGLYNADTAMDVIKGIVSPEVLADHHQRAKKCDTVNAEAVSDGAEGCDRAKLVFDCVFTKQDIELVLGKW